MSFSMKGYQIENFAGIPVYDKEQAMQGRVHYVTSHIMEEHDFSLVTLRMQLSGPNALSPISNPITNVRQPISLNQFLYLGQLISLMQEAFQNIKTDDYRTMLELEQVIGRTLRILNRPLNPTKEEAAAYNENIDQAMSLVQHLSGHKSPLMRGVGIALMRVGLALMRVGLALMIAILCAALLNISAPVLIAIGAICASVGAVFTIVGHVLNYYAQAGGLSKAMTTVVENATKIDSLGGGTGDSSSEDLRALKELFIRNVMPRVERYFKRNVGDENIILLEGIRRKLQAGADPRELSSMFKHALSPENRFDFFESIAGICGVNVIRLLNVRSDEEEVTWPPEDEWKTSQQEYTERPQFKRMPVQDPENEIEAFIYLHHKNPYEVLGISPEGCDADTLKQAYRKMMLKYHPDKCKDQSIATSMSQILNGAYSALFSHHQKPKGDEALVKEKTRQILILA